MARRRSTKGGGALGVFMLLALAIGGLGSAYDAIKASLPTGDALTGILLLAAGFVLGLIVLWRFLIWRQERKEIKDRISAIEHRRQCLIMKYHDASVVDAIMAGQIWHDMTKEQLIESWGSPVDISTKVLKSKVKEVYKYNRTGVNRFSRRAMLENDLVVGWEE